MRSIPILPAEDRERRCRALAMSSLLARASREGAFVVDHDTEEAAVEGLRLLADDHLEELAALLGVTKPRNN